MYIKLILSKLHLWAQRKKGASYTFLQKALPIIMLITKHKLIKHRQHSNKLRACYPQQSTYIQKCDTNEIKTVICWHVCICLVRLKAETNQTLHNF